MFAVYILASQKNGTLYIGSTNDLKRRVWEHKDKVVKGFTEKYCVDKLVYYEMIDGWETARLREFQLKKWNRAWKLKLIEEKNPNWEDLADRL